MAVVIRHNRKDDDGHKYLVPDEMLEDFDVLLQRAEDAPFLSEEKWAAEDEFIYHFHQYMVG